MGGVMPVVHYPSLAEFVRSLPAQVPKSQKLSIDPEMFNLRDAWSGNQTYGEARANIYKGDPDGHAESERLLDAMLADGIETKHACLEFGRAGNFPCIPAFLAGDPEGMLRLVETPTESAPIKLFVDVGISGAFKASDLVKRGAAILAFARKLSEIRPLELYVYASLYGNDAQDGHGACAIPVIGLATNPLDLTTASYVLTNPGFLRRVLFVWGISSDRGFNGKWAWDTRPSSSEHQERLKRALGASEEDLVISGAHAGETSMRDPKAWVDAQVKYYTERVEA
jgi:hypothetical protein